MFAQKSERAEISWFPLDRSPIEISRVILLVNLFNNIFQSMNSETIHQKQGQRGVKCEETPHPAGKQYLEEIDELLTGHKCFTFNIDRIFWLSHY